MNLTDKIIFSAPDAVSMKGVVNSSGGTRLTGKFPTTKIEGKEVVLLAEEWFFLSSELPQGVLEALSFNPSTSMFSGKIPARLYEDLKGQESRSYSGTVQIQLSSLRAKALLDVDIEWDYGFFSVPLDFKITVSRVYPKPRIELRVSGTGQSSGFGSAVVDGSIESGIASNKYTLVLLNSDGSVIPTEKAWWHFNGDPCPPGVSLELDAKKLALVYAGTQCQKLAAHFVTVTVSGISEKVQKDFLCEGSSDEYKFSVRIKRGNPNDETTDEITDGEWLSYNHVRIRERGETAGIVNSWSMTGLTSSVSLTGLSNADALVGVQMDSTGQGIRLTSTEQAVLVSVTHVGVRRVQTSYGSNKVWSNVANDVQFNRVSLNRFVANDPPVIDVEFNSYNIPDVKLGQWAGPMPEAAFDDAAVWNEGGKSAWFQIGDAELAMVDPACLDYMGKTKNFMKSWNFMKDITGVIPDLNRGIPGVKTHIPPLADKPMNYGENALPGYAKFKANNGRARLVVAAGFNQTFQLFSGWGRAFYFSPTSHYYMCTVRQYYDTLAQTVGNLTYLVNGSANTHYRCMTSMPEVSNPARWSTGMPDQVIATTYEHAMSHEIVDLSSGYDYEASPPISEDKKLAHFSMQRNPVLNTGKIKFTSDVFEVRSRKSGAPSFFLKFSDIPDAGSCIHLETKDGCLLRAKSLITDVEQRIALKVQKTVMTMSDEALAAKTSGNVFLDGASIHIGTLV